MQTLKGLDTCGFEMNIEGLNIKSMYDIPKELIDSLYSTGYTQQKIGEIFGYSGSAIGLLMIKYGLKRITRKELGDKLRKVIPYKELYQLYVVEEKSFETIGKLYGMSYNAVSNRLKEYHIPTRTGYGGSRRKNNTLPNRKCNISKEKLEDLYYNQLHTTVEIGEMYGVADSNIRRYMEEYGLARKTPGEMVQLRGTTKGEKSYMYGKEGYWKGKTIPESTMKALHARNAELRKDPTTHPMYGKHHTKEARKRMSECMYLRWQDPNYVKKVCAKRYPNKLESCVSNILDEYYPNVWKYNGDLRCDVVVDGMVPDFVHASDKKVIEVFGDYWHSDEVVAGNWKRTEFGRKAIYSQYGYDCAVLWEKDINNYGSEFVITEVNKL